MVATGAFWRPTPHTCENIFAIRKKFTEKLHENPPPREMQTPCWNSLPAQPVRRIPSTDDSASHRRPTAALSLVPQRIVLDTSVLIADPMSMHAFAGCAVVIPLTVVEELDGLKTRMDDVGRAARTALRNVEELRRRAGGSLAEPTPLTDDPESATLHIEVNGVQHDRLADHGLDAAVPDNRIIGAAIGQSLIGPTCLVSNDAALRIKAAHLGLTADEHHPVARTIAERMMGWVTLEADADAVDSLYQASYVEADRVPGCEHLYNNNFVVVRHGSQSALARLHDGRLTLLDTNVPEAWGLRARNKEQRFA
ncbi:MAG: hypothetical protein EBS71_07580, partial [Actinobacteria bacterium]|nr:hypothetical protein [Actinomycetota bacterium]